MKKYMIMLMVAAFIVSTVFMGVGCKEEAAGEVEEATEEVTEEAVEEVAEEEVAEEEAAAEPVHLEWWDWEPDYWQEIFEGVVAEFQKTYPNFTATRRVIPYQDYLAALKTGIASGEGADIYCLTPGYMVDDVYQSGQYVDLTDYVTDGEMADWYKNVWETRGFWHDEKIIQLPNQSAITAVGYWRDMWPDGPPDTIEDFYEGGERLKSEGIIPLAAPFGASNWCQHFFVAFLKQLDDSIYDMGDVNMTDLISRMEKGEISWDQPEVRQTVEQLKAFVEDGMVNSNAVELLYYDALELFNTRQASMFFGTATWSLQILDQDGLANDEIGVMKMPRFADGNVFYEGGTGACPVINPNGANVEIAIEFAKMFASPFAANLFAERRLMPICVEDVTIDPGIPMYTELKNETETSDMMVGNFNSNDTVEAYFNAFQGYLLGMNDIDTLVNDLDAISGQ